MNRDATYNAALRAFRSETAAPAEGSISRARVLITVERRRTQAAVVQRVSFLGAVVVLGLSVASAAWAAVAHWRAETPRSIEEATSDESLLGAARPRGGRQPARVIPTSAPDLPSPSSPASAADEMAAYSRAHRVHFVDDAPARALAAWDDYLASHPGGIFAPEAAYNRALCMMRLGKFADASKALRPFARGRFGAYRRDQAAWLLDWLAERMPKKLTGTVM